MRRLDVLLVLKALNDASMAGGAPASHHQQDAVAHSPHIQAGVHLVFSLSQELVCRPRSFQAVSTPAYIHHRLNTVYGSCHHCPPHPQQPHHYNNTLHVPVCHQEVQNIGHETMRADFGSNGDRDVINNQVLFEGTQKRHFKKGTQRRHFKKGTGLF